MCGSEIEESYICVSSGGERVGRPIEVRAETEGRTEESGSLSSEARFVCG